MFIFIDKENRVYDFAKEVIEQDGVEYPTLISANGGAYKIPTVYLKKFSTGKYFKEVELPEDFALGLSYYDETKGFYKREPLNKWGIPEETVQAIKEEAIAEVQEGAKNG